MQASGETEVIREELKKGNFILIDHVEGRAAPYILSVVEKVAGEIIFFSNESKRNYKECAPVPLSDIWLAKFGVSRNSLPSEIKFLHHLQNYLGGPTINNQTECMNCNCVWGWNDKDIFDFNIPVGKRVWTAVCVACKADIERRFKEKTINRSQLMLEFTRISGCIAKKCAISSSDAIGKLKEFKPHRKGK